ncbi:MAG: ABC transporter ATP-binding protein [Candidatus Paceibacterota bacterium]|jgi:ABC-type multidrug transport system fused ATPase/permease subunit
MQNSNHLKGWKIIFKYLLGYRQEVILMSVLGIIIAFADGFIPFIAGRFFDAIIKKNEIFTLAGSYPTWAIILALWALVQTVSIVVNRLYSMTGSKVDNLLYSEYMARGYSTLLLFPLKFHTERKTGEVASSLQRSASWLTQIVSNVIVTFAPQFISVIIGLGVSFFINFYLGLVLVIGIGIYVVLMFGLVRSAGWLNQKQWEAFSKAFEKGWEGLVNVQSVKQFAGENVFAKNIYHLFVNVAGQISRKREGVWNNIYAIQRGVVVATQFTIFVVSVALITNGIITLGDLLALNGYAGLVFGPFTILGRNWQTIQNGLLAIEKTEAIVTSEQEVYEPKNAIRPKQIFGDIEFKDVVFGYGDRKNNVLSGISFKVKRGMTVALVGGSGVGKSTLIELISAYYFPKKGKVLIDGIYTKKLPLSLLRSYIAIVPQEVVLFNDTVENNIKYGKLGAKKKEIEQAAKHAKANEFIDAFPKKYKQIVGERGIKLSVGQKQRIAIARAILKDAPILVLDEPTSALDSETERSLTETLKELMKGRTTFIIAHRLSTVRYSDLILVMKEGKIIESGNHDELMEKEGGEYRRLYEMHIGLY